MSQQKAVLDPRDLGVLSDVELTDDNVLDVGDVPEPDPKMTDPGWVSFVMKQFLPDEMDGDGNPRIDGLRRVVSLLFGPILKSHSRVVQAPRFPASYDRATLLEPAVVEHFIEVLVVNRPELQGLVRTVEVTDAADLYFANAPDANFARYPTAMASTRAEARCLRKLLRLKKSSEEMSSLPQEDAATNGLITPTQISFINVLARRVNIDVMKYVNSGRKQYQSIHDVPYGTAAKINEHLSSLQNSPDQIKAEWLGYKSDWLTAN